MKNLIKATEQMKYDESEYKSPINILDLKLNVPEVGWHIDGTSLNILAKITLYNKEVARITQCFQTNKIRGIIMVFESPFSDAFSFDLLHTKEFDYAKENHMEIIELIFSIIKTKIPQVNEIINYVSELKFEQKIVN